MIENQASSPQHQQPRQARGDGQPGGRFAFDCRFTPEIRGAIRRRRIALGLPYHAIAEFFDVNWSTFRKWELGPTETCELIHRPRIEGFLNGDYDRALGTRAGGVREPDADGKDAAAGRPVQMCMERVANAYGLCRGHAEIVGRLLDAVDDATRDALAELVRLEAGKRREGGGETPRAENGPLRRG